MINTYKKIEEEFGQDGYRHALFRQATIALIERQNEIIGAKMNESIKTLDAKGVINSSGYYHALHEILSLNNELLEYLKQK